MTQLNMAHNELFRRTADESFDSLDTLLSYCRDQRDQSSERWRLPQELNPHVGYDTVSLEVDGSLKSRLNSWSFSQLCRMSGVSRETLNRLSPDTASRALQETIPRCEKPVQLLITDTAIRSVHGVSYTRLWNADLLETVTQYASDFQQPQTAVTGGTGLYCGEQDMFVFLIDPAGWTEIDGQAFAPGFFVWNSEVGRRSLGIQTFWFQSVCQNHIVWDAVEVVDFTRKHTANVSDGLNEIGRIIERLVSKRDERRDGFFKVMRKAMAEKLGHDNESALKQLTKRGFSRKLAAETLEQARQSGALTIFAVVDALTKIAQTARYAGERLDADIKAAALLQLVA